MLFFAAMHNTAWFTTLTATVGAVAIGAYYKYDITWYKGEVDAFYAQQDKQDEADEKARKKRMAELLAEHSG